MDEVVEERLGGVRGWRLEKIGVGVCEGGGVGEEG